MSDDPATNRIRWCGDHNGADSAQRNGIFAEDEMREPIKDKTIIEMTKKDFENLPVKDWQEDIGKFDAIVIIPGKYNELHKSGFRLITYVFCKGHYPICKSSGCSDVLRLNGIGGYGGYKKDLDLILKTRLAPIIDWSMDCLPKSGYMRLWCSYDLTNETDMSSFDVIANTSDRRTNRNN